MRTKALFFFALMTIPAGVWAQHLGIETGIAGIENYKMQTNLSLSVFFPLAGKMHGTIIYTRWSGSDMNYNIARQYTDSWTNATYLGSRGLQCILLFNLLKAEKLSFFTGLGTGWYQKFWLDTSHNKQLYQQASYTGMVLGSFGLSPKLSLTVRGMLSLERIIGLPKWSFLNLGLMYKLW